MKFTHLPITPLRITSKFGKRNTGIKGASTNHKGVDLGRDTTKSKTPITCVRDGVVSTNAWNKYRGWYIVIDHGNDYATLYQHLESQSKFKNGSKVKGGQIIGIMGNSSDTSVLKIATHLHFELQYKGEPINPEPYFYDLEEVEDMTKEETQALLNGKDTKVSDWAKTDWEEMTKLGIFDGQSPKGVCTREQMAVILNRFMKIINK